MTRKKKITIAVIVVATVLVLNVALCVLSACNFYTLNYFRSIPGYLTLKWTDADMVEIRGGEDRLVLVDWDKNPPSLTEYMEMQGYTKVEQEGYLFTFEKDGEQQSITQWPGGDHFPLPYTIWEWH